MLYPIIYRLSTIHPFGGAGYLLSTVCWKMLLQFHHVHPGSPWGHPGDPSCHCSTWFWGCLMRPRRTILPYLSDKKIPGKPSGGLNTHSECSVPEFLTQANLCNSAHFWSLSFTDPVCFWCAPSSAIFGRICQNPPGFMLGSWQLWFSSLQSGWTSSIPAQNPCPPGSQHPPWSSQITSNQTP